MYTRGVYYIASMAREKLMHEVALKDHDLRRIVHHATLYDNLLNECYSDEEQEGSDIVNNLMPYRESAHAGLILFGILRQNRSKHPRQRRSDSDALCGVDKEHGEH